MEISPSEQLTDRIMEALIDNQLILAVDAIRLRLKFAAGTVSPEDWRLPIEKAIDMRQER